jgi:CMP-2-keto-3-deoxyoctulosonic acid synthetase
MACRKIEVAGTAYNIYTNAIMTRLDNYPGTVDVLTREYVPVNGGDSVIVNVRADCSILAIVNSEAITATLINGQNEFQTSNAGQIADIIFAVAIDDVIALVDFARRGPLLIKR